MGVFVFLTTFFIYVWGAYPTVTAQDAGELIVGPATLSIVHPPGYPLYVVLGHVWNTLFPLGSVAFRINLLSGVLTACALWGAFTLLRAHLPSLLAGCVAIGIGVTSQIWDQALVAEVYPLHLAACAWLLVGLHRSQLTADSRQPNPKMFWLILLWGVSLANHQLMVLWAPVMLWLMIRSGWRSTWPGLLLVGLGVALYAVLMVRSLANPPMDWGNPETWTGWWAHLMRRQYGAVTSARHTLAAFGHQLAFAGRTMWSSWGWLLPMSVIGGVWWVKRSRTFGWMLIGMALISSVGVVLLANVRAVPMQEHQVRAFFAPAVLMIGLLVAGAVQGLLRIENLGSLSRRDQLKFGFSTMVLGAGVMLVVARGWADHRHERDLIVRSYASDLMACLPPGSVTVLTGDFPTFPAGYVAHVEGAAHGRRIGDEAGSVFRLAKISPELVEDSGVPVFTSMSTDVMTSDAFRYVPEGLVYRVVSLSASPDALTPRMDKAAWRRLSLGAPLTEFSTDSFPRYLRNQYYAFSLAEWSWFAEGPTAAWARYEKIIRDPMAGETLIQTIGTLLERRGATAYAERCFDAAAHTATWSAHPVLALARFALARSDDRRAEALYAEAERREPESATVQFQLGNFLAKRRRTEEAIRAYERAIARDPGFVGAHKNLGAAFLDAGQLDRAIDRTVMALRLNPNDYQLHANLGAMYLQEGDKRRALTAWEHALRLNPRDQRLAALVANLRAEVPSP